MEEVFTLSVHPTSFSVRVARYFVPVFCFIGVVLLFIYNDRFFDFKILNLCFISIKIHLFAIFHSHLML
jgi:hypothetical protein